MVGYVVMVMVLVDWENGLWLVYMVGECRFNNHLCRCFFSFEDVT